MPSYPAHIIAQYFKLYCKLFEHMYRDQMDGRGFGTSNSFSATSSRQHKARWWRAPFSIWTGGSLDYSKNVFPEVEIAGNATMSQRKCRRGKDASNGRKTTEAAPKIERRISFATLELPSMSGSDENRSRIVEIGSHPALKIEEFFTKDLRFLPRPDRFFFDLSIDSRPSRHVDEGEFLGSSDLPMESLSKSFFFHGYREFPRWYRNLHILSVLFGSFKGIIL